MIFLNIFIYDTVINQIMKKAYPLLFMLFTSVVFAQGKLKLAKIFSDNMVLQQRSGTRFWE